MNRHPHLGRRRADRPYRAEEITIGPDETAIGADDSLGSADDSLIGTDLREIGADDRGFDAGYGPIEAGAWPSNSSAAERPQPVVLPSWLVAAAVLLAGAALTVAALWWQHRTRVVEVTQRVVPYYPAGPDAMGCPTGVRCEVRADTGQPLAVLARRLFPDATVLSSVSVTAADTGRTVQATIVLRTPAGLELTAVSQCVPGAGPIPTRAAALPVLGPAQADFVVPGRPGCSVAVAAQIPRSVPVPLRELQQLAGDPDAQLQS